MNLDKIAGQYVICEFGLDKHKLCYVESETKAKFEFLVYYLENGHNKLLNGTYKQMKNTIIAVGTFDEMMALYRPIFDIEQAREKLMQARRELLADIREKFKK